VDLIVNYSAVSDEMKDMIELAMNQWTSLTCVRFVETGGNTLSFLNFRTDRDGCYSFVGRQATITGQDVNLGPGCDKVKSCSIVGC